MEMVTEMGSAVNGNSNGTVVSYQWVTNVLIGVVILMLAGGIGWIKTTQDALAEKVGNIPPVLQQMTDGLHEVNRTISDMKEHMSTQDAAIAADHDDVTKLKTKIESHQEWIDAHIHGDKAQRELHGLANDAP
jgi:peptidoglycan hydrolase CwlO-like protein